jgi:hypothetical protein
MLYVTEDAIIKDKLYEDSVSEKVLVEAPITTDLEQRLREVPFLIISTRSMLAQRGVEVLGIHGCPFGLADHKLKWPLSILYRSGRRINLDVGDPICRFYQPGDLMINRERLEGLIENGELDLGNNYRIANEVGAVEIGTKNVKLIPPPNQPKVLTMEDLEKDRYPLQYQEVNSLTLGLGEFLVTETKPIRLPPNVYGDVVVGFDEEEPVHAHSTLLDPGFNGSLRLEFWGWVDEVQAQNGILRLYEDTNQKQQAF